MDFFVFFQAEDGIRDLVRSRGLVDVYKGQDQCVWVCVVCVLCVLCVCCVSEYLCVLCVSVCGCVFCACRCSDQCRCQDLCSDQCSDQCTDAQINVCGCVLCAGSDTHLTLPSMRIGGCAVWVGVGER